MLPTGEAWEQNVAIDSASGMHSRRTVLGILAAAVVPDDVRPGSRAVAATDPA